jgi:hypothetical protein
MKSTNAIVIIVIGAVVFIVGVGLGIFYQAQADSMQVTKTETANALSSKVIPSIVAYGTVTKIDGNNITLTAQGDTLTVAVSPDAKVISFSSTAGSTAAPTQKDASFSDVRTGDSINIAVKVMPDGQIQGQTVIILPGSTPVQ